MSLLLPITMLLTRLLLCYCNHDISRPMTPIKYPLFWYSFSHFAYFSLMQIQVLLDHIDSRVVVASVSWVKGELAGIRG